jgi:hypothetical protein
MEMCIGTNVVVSSINLNSTFVVPHKIKKGGRTDSMDINILPLLSIVITFESAFFFAFPGLFSSPTVIADLSVTRWGYNSDTTKALCDQYGFYWVGIVLLFGSIVLQFLSISIGSSIIPLTSYNIIFSIGLGIGVFIISWVIAKLISKRTNKIAIELIIIRHKI